MSTNFAGESPPLSVVIPAYNEATRLPASIEKILRYLDACHPRFELIVVDDGSSDGTAQAAVAAAGGRAELRVESYGGNRGKGYAVRHGLAAARGELVLFTDADLSTPIEAFEPLKAALDAGADVAIGSRALPQSDVQVRQPLFRDLGGKFFNAMVRLLLLPDLHDTQCGFKLFRRAPVLPLVARMRIDRFAFDVEILYLARLAGLRIAEVPVVWVNSPDSRVRMSHAAAAFVDLLRIRRWHGA